jgi:hypothetical protein
MSTVFRDGATATGTAALYLPADESGRELMGLIRLGQKVAAQWVGRRTGTLAHVVLRCAQRGGPPYTFKQLLYELEYEAVIRSQDGERASPIEKVDRHWQLVTYHDPKLGRQQRPFATVRNKLTEAKSILKNGNNPFPDSPKPGIVADRLGPS